MRWTEREYSKGQIDKAGRTLIASQKTHEELELALDILNNWRSCHSYPINTFQATLRKRIKKLGVEGLVSQRLKRIPSIIKKLERYDNMNLSRMQDIGGIRAVLSNTKDVYKLADRYQKVGFQHELVNDKDYILNPKPDGYRSIHLIYRYSNNINHVYDGLMIELQIRTKLQHAWATAVETIGTFLNSSLKSNEGPEEWLNFFALTSSAFAYIEGTTLVPGYENLPELNTFQQVAKEAERLKVAAKLQTFRIALTAIDTDKKPGTYHLLVLDPVQKEVSIRTYPKRLLEKATSDYLQEEKDASEGQKQVVLVAATSIKTLKEAYPNYFLDTQEFLKALTNINKRLVAKELDNEKA